MLLPHDILGCQILHYCLYMNWTAQLVSKIHYWDAKGIHFRSHVNTRFNEELLNLIQTIQYQYPQQHQQHKQILSTLHFP
jgi:hypothetical protein